MHKVVAPFPYAGNGYTLENLNVGDERDFGQAAEGLRAAGLIAEIGAVGPVIDPVPTVEVVAETVADVIEPVIEPASDTTDKRRGRPRKG